MTLDQQIGVTEGLPKESGVYNVVQVQIDGKEHCYFGRAPMDIPIADYSNVNKYGHGKLLYDALIKAGIPNASIKHELGENLVLKGERYEILGMGYAAVDDSKKLVAFFGESSNYEIGINKDIVSRRQKQFPEWKFHVV